MDLGYGTEYEAYREEVRGFLRAHWPPGTSPRDASAEHVRAFRRAAIDAGYLYRSIPRRYGGSEQVPDILAAQIIREEFGAVRAPMELTGQGPSMVAPTLLEWGSDWQREKFVRKAIEGEHIWCQGYSEPGAGSDLASLRTTGELRNGEWVINGQKIWTTHWKRAQYMFALVRTEPDASKHAGISYLLLEMDQPGVEVRPLKQITGDSEFAEVFLNDARTPEDWIVGRRGEGWTVSRSLLRHERNMIGSANRSTGLFQSLLRLARKATIDGRPAIEDRQVREALASIHGYVQTQRCSSYIQLTRELQGRDPGTLPLLNKLNDTNIGQQVALLAQRLVGAESALAQRGQPEGLTSGNEKWSNQFMGSLGMAIAGGTSNIQRNIIAERGLGLPRGRGSGPDVNFDLSEEQRLLEETVDKFLATECPMTSVREIFDGDVGFDEAIWQGLGEMGVLGLHLPEELGGAGLELLELAVVAEAMGRRATPGPFFEHVLASMAVDRAGSDAQREEWLPRLASGEARATLALSEPGADEGWLPKQWKLAAAPNLDGEKRFVPHARGADLIVVGLAGGGLALVEATAAGLSSQRLQGLDRTRRLDCLRFSATPCEPLPRGAEVSGQILDAGLVLLAADAHGGGMACVEAAVEYAKTREQFGVKIGSFQALKHQLADMAVEIHPARGLVWYAAHAFDHLPEEASAAAANAKAHLTDRFVDIARRTVEAHGGLGYTWECDVQFWFKRALFDWSMLGDPGLHRRRTADLLGW